MGDKKTLLELRSSAKKAKPSFTRTNAFKVSRIKKDVWRKARGRHNKIRLGMKGKNRPKVGYGAPSKVKGMHASGKHEVIIQNKDSLKIVDKKEQVARIAASVGRKKRLEIMAEAKTLGIRILNPSVRVMETLNPKKKAVKKEVSKIEKKKVGKKETPVKTEKKEELKKPEVKKKAPVKKAVKKTVKKATKAKKK